MSDLTEFLLARIAEDEAVARAALAPDQMHPYGDRSLPRVRPDQVPDEMRGYLGGTWGEHAARWDMTRVLAECEAKRRIIAEHQEAATARVEDPSDLSAKIAGLAFEIALRALAQPHADHPDFRPEWRV